MNEKINFDIHKNNIDMDDNVPDMPLSNDPEENLRMENELLRLKIQAEHGGQSHTSGELPPELENMFLKNVMEFEQNYARAKPATVFELAGKPSFKRSEELNDAELEKALESITELLGEKNIGVYFGDKNEYDSRTQYRFITEELFQHESTFTPMPGMTTHYDYEEFHPNHKKDIENRAVEFLTEWFNRSLNEQSWELANQFVLPDRKIMTKGDIVAQLKRIFDSYAAFKDGDYKIIDIGFQLEEGQGIGHAEGGVKYDAVFENGESTRIVGPFKLYMTLEYGWWSIFHIVFPGFQYF